MSNALTTELWDQAEPRRRWQVFHSKGSSQHVQHILMALGSFSLPQGTNHGQFLETTRGERKWLNLERIGRTSYSKDQSGKWTAWKEKKSPDPPGLEPGTLLVMSNALTTELWDQAEPRRRWQVFHSKGSSQHVPHILMALGSFSLPQGTNHGQFLETTRGERKWLNLERIGRTSYSKDQSGKWTAWKEKKTPDPPGLEPGTLLVMSNALTTELWDQAEPRRRWQVFHSKGSSQHWSFEYEVLPILSKFNHFLSPLVVSRNWPWLVPWGREKDPSAISMCGTCCELPLEWKTCQRLLGSAWSHSSVVRALLMTSRVPGSSPGGSGVFFSFQAVHFPDWSFEYEVLPILSKFNHFLSPLVVSRNWPWLVPWGREKDPSAISMCGTCCELPLEWKTCQRLLGSAWSHSSVVRALLMTSRVPGSSPGGSGVFFSFQAVHFPDWSFEYEVLPILSKFNHFLSPLVVSRNWPWLVPWGREKDPSAISMCGTCCELPLEWKTCQRLLGSAWSHSSVVRALLMTSRVPGSSPGGSGVFFSFQAVHFPDWSFEYEVLPILSKFNHFLSPLVVSRNWPWLVPWGREKDPSAISMCGTCCELPLEWKTCQRLLGSAWSHSSVVRALLMTSRVPGSSPGGSGVFFSFQAVHFPDWSFEYEVLPILSKLLLL